MTRADLRAHMSAQEFGQWVAIFMVQPFDDRHLYDLPQALVRASLIALEGGKPEVDKLLWSKAGKAATLDDVIADLGKI